MTRHRSGQWASMTKRAPAFRGGRLQWSRMKTKESIYSVSDTREQTRTQERGWLLGHVARSGTALVIVDIGTEACRSHGASHVPPRQGKGPDMQSCACKGRGGSWPVCSGDSREASGAGAGDQLCVDTRPGRGRGRTD